MDTTKRDLFERTTRERLGLQDDHDLRRSALIPDDYADPDTQRMWAGWQLAAQALAAPSADGRGTDAQIEKEREIARHAIVGAIAAGHAGQAHPGADHWLAAAHDAGARIAKLSRPDDASTDKEVIEALAAVDQLWPGGDDPERGRWAFETLSNFVVRHPNRPVGSWQGDAFQSSQHPWSPHTGDSSMRYDSDWGSARARTGQRPLPLISLDGAQRVHSITPPVANDPEDVLRQVQLLSQPAAPQVLEALRKLLDRYVTVAASGDAGHWNPEEDREVIAARAILKQAHAAAPVQAASPDDLIRVAVFGFGSCELYAKYEHIQHEVESHLDDGVPVPDDSPTYTLTFKTITRAEFDALGEFDGF